MKLLFTIKNQTLYLMTRGAVVADSQGYLGAKFTFTADWNDAEKYVQFKRGELFYDIKLDENDECVVPWEVLAGKGVVNVNVYGTNKEGKVNKLITANSVDVMVEASGLTDAGEPIDPTDGILGNSVRIALQTISNAEAEALKAIDAEVGKAESAAVTAVNAKNSAIASASNAKTSEGNAAESATSAANSASSAAASATNASSSASTAAQKASGAATSEANAKASETAALNAVATRNLKTYTSLAQLGLDSTATVLDICSALPDNSMFSSYIGSSVYAAMGLPNRGVLTINKSSDNATLTLSRINVSTNTQEFYFTAWNNGLTDAVKWHKLLNNEIQSFSSAAQLGLDAATATELDIVAAMPSNSVFIQGVNKTNNPNLQIYSDSTVTSYGRLIITKVSSNNYIFEYFGSDGGGYWFATGNLSVTTLKYYKQFTLEDGYVTKNILLNNNAAIINTKNDYYLGLFSDSQTWNLGALLALYGSGHSTNAGHFILRARSSQGNYTLQGKPDGKLTWGGENVALEGALSMPNLSSEIAIDTSMHIGSAGYSATNVTYTAPSDGWIVVRGKKKTAGNTSLIDLRLDAERFLGRFCSGYGIDSDVAGFSPVAAGATVVIAGYNIDTMSAYFYYTQSEV